ncbi:hypothetical protein [uncultured Alistipes sp.]|jgi:hypothetical protein|uniref:hypothetical protein n=1 Tax=uncultured Alistipes sp. TaxID=538949 RepID=UPI0025D95F52|nr:hypothetical protein [uncultured Alistipes sp.]
MRLASFDIFDTVLIRKCGRPATVFHLLARRLFPNDDARRREFIAWRKGAEPAACREHNSLNVTLGLIYASFDAGRFGLTAEYASGQEKAVERENLLVTPAVKLLVERKRAEGCRICFISDMYLDSGFLSEVLSAHGILLEHEELFVSCEWNARKSTGELFGIVRRQYRPDHWEHYGDNRVGDYSRPRRLGIEAHLVDTGYTGAEKCVENKYRGHALYPEVSLLVGFQRAARIAAGNDYFAQIAADFVAPVYISYVAYVLEQARRQGIRRLYFVNRDGYILLKIAEMLSPRYPEIELRYIFISRRAIAAPSITRPDPTLLTGILNPQTLVGKKVTGLLNYLGIDRQRLTETGIGFRYERIVNDAQAADFAGKVFCSAYTPVWTEQAARSRELFMRYLDQEGVTGGVNCAMVDLGWYGSTRLMLNRILRHYGRPGVPFFYFSAADNALPSEYGEYHTFMPYRLIANSGLMGFMEQYCSVSPYGSAVSFEVRQGQVVPVLEERERSPGSERILSANIDTARRIVSYMGGIGLGQLFEQVGADYLRLMRDQRVKLNLEPLALAGGASDMDGSRQDFVRRMSPAQTVRYAFLGSRITTFDRACVALTYGPRLSKILFRLHGCTGAFRRFLYSRYMLYKQSGPVAGRKIPR